MLRAVVRLLAGLVVGVLTTTIVLFLGPESTVSCGDGHVGNRVAQRITQSMGAGHVDGASASSPTAKVVIADGVSPVRRIIRAPPSSAGEIAKMSTVTKPDVRNAFAAFS